MLPQTLEKCTLEFLLSALIIFKIIYILEIQFFTQLFRSRNNYLGIEIGHITESPLVLYFCL